MIGEAAREKVHIGYKQALRALNDNNASKVFIASDCEDRIKDEIAALALKNNTPVSYVPTMRELGSMCSIDIGASCAVILK